MHPERCASLFKRHMGGDWTAALGGRTFTPEELSSRVLAALKADAEAFFGRPVTRSTCSVDAGTRILTRAFHGSGSHGLA